MAKNLNRKVWNRLVWFQVKLYGFEKGFARYVRRQLLETETTLIAHLVRNPNANAIDIASRAGRILSSDLRLVSFAVRRGLAELAESAPVALTAELNRAVPIALRRVVHSHRQTLAEADIGADLPPDNPFDPPDDDGIWFFRPMPQWVVEELLDELEQENLGVKAWEAVSQIQASRIRDVIASEVAKGSTSTETSKKLHTAMFGGAGVEGLGFNTFAATDSMVRTQVQRVGNKILSRTWQENKDVLQQDEAGNPKAVWTSALDTAVCLRCAVLDGTIVTVGEPPEAPLHHRCRCVTTPHIESWENLGIEGIPELSIDIRNSMDGDVPGDMTYTTWFAEQGTKRQKQILGPRYELWKSGKIQFKDFVSFAGQVPVRLRTLKSLR